MNIQAHDSPRGLARRGLTLVEITIAVFLLAVSMILTVRVLGWVASERRAGERRQCATREAANVMERLAALPWERVTADTAKSLTFSDTARQSLPSGELDVTVDEPAGSDAKRMSVRVRWRNRGGEWDAPVRLTAWKFRAGRNAR